MPDTWDVSCFSHFIREVCDIRILTYIFTYIYICIYICTYVHMFMVSVPSPLCINIKYSFFVNPIF